MYKNKKISVIMPAYNEELLIIASLESIPDYIDHVYAIDDCSQDLTYELIQAYAKKNPHVELIRHNVNSGVGAAIVTGYKKSLEDGVDIAVVMAGDNQMDPKYIPSLIDPLIEGKADYTKGNRLTSLKTMKGMSPLRMFGNFILSLITKASSGYWDISDPQNGYTAIKTEVLTNINLDQIWPSYGYCNDLLTKLNVGEYLVKDIDIPARYGQEKSKIKLGRYIKNLSKLLIRNFFWRIHSKYIKRKFSLIAILYDGGICLTIFGLALEIITIASEVFNLRIINLLNYAIYPITMGIIFVLLGILLDMRQNEKEQRLKY